MKFIVLCLAIALVSGAGQREETPSDDVMLGGFFDEFWLGFRVGL